MFITICATLSQTVSEAMTSCLLTWLSQAWNGAASGDCCCVSCAALGVSLLATIFWILKPSVDEKALKRAKELLNWPLPANVEGNGKANINAAPLKGNLRCHDPATLEDLGNVPVMTPEQVVDAVASSRRAQQQWCKTSFSERRRVMSVLRQLILDNSTQIAEIAARDSGKTLLDAMIGEILTVCEKLRWVNSSGEGHLKPEKRSTGLLATKKAVVEYLPCGVVGCIIPWNYPFQNIYGSIIAPVFAGCGVVVKPSEWTSWSTPYLGQLFRVALEACGHDPNLVQFVTGDGTTGKALVNSGVDKVIFIGSPLNGKRVMAAASETLTPVTLELGGKDPMIICDDADIDQVIPIAMRGVYQNMGQNCIGVERIYIAENLHDKFVARVGEIGRSMRQGLPLAKGVDCGAMAMPGQIDIVDALVQDAVRGGAQLVCGGRRNPNLEGQFYEPTILANVTNEMNIVQKEVFGPVMLIMKTTSDEHAVQLANDSEYALAGCVFSRNLGRAEKLARKMQGGTILVNDFGVAYLCQELPFGGLKISGFGKFNGKEGLRDACVQKVILSDLIPGMRSSIPPALQYPVKENIVSLAQSVLKIVYSAGMARRARALHDFLRAALWGQK